MSGHFVGALIMSLTVIGLATALTLPNRQTASVTKAAGGALSQVYGTVING